MVTFKCAAKAWLAKQYMQYVKKYKTLLEKNFVRLSAHGELSL